jgi:hypothetical protein
MILSLPTFIGVILASASTGVVVGIAGKKIYDKHDCFVDSNNFFEIDVSPCLFCSQEDLEAGLENFPHSRAEPHSRAKPLAFEGSKWNDFLKLHAQ